MALSLLLTAIHSQIVATASSSSQSSDKIKNRFSLNGVNGLINGRKKRERVKKRKKSVRIARNVSNDLKITSAKLSSMNILPDNSRTTITNSNCINNNNKNSIKLCDINVGNLENNNTDSLIDNKKACEISSTDLNNYKKSTETKSKMLLNIHESEVHLTDDNDDNDVITNTVTLRTEKIDNLKMCTNNVEHVQPLASPSCSIRKRNVYWDSPIRSHVFTSMPAYENVKNEEGNQPPLTPNRSSTGDDDGFESLNGKSSSGEDANVSSVSVGETEERTQQKYPYTNSWLNDVTEKCDIPKVSSSSDTDTLRTLPVVDCNAESTPIRLEKPSNISLLKMNTKHYAKLESSDTDEENDECEHILTPATEVTTSATERVCVTTNSEDCSYSSGMNQSDSQNDRSEDDLEFDVAPTTILNSSCGASDRGKVSIVIFV